MSHKYHQVMADWSRDMVQLLHWSANTCFDPATGSGAHPLKGGVHKNHFSRQIHSRNCAKGYEDVAMSSNFWSYQAFESLSEHTSIRRDQTYANRFDHNAIVKGVGLRINPYVYGCDT